MIKISDQQFENFVGNQLRVGVIISAIVTLIGGVFYIFHYGSMSTNYQHFHRVAVNLCNIKGILQSALQLSPQGIIQLGVLLLLATPIVRVALSIFGFALQRDRLYTIITIIVFVVLMYSLLTS